MAVKILTPVVTSLHENPNNQSLTQPNPWMDPTCAQLWPQLTCTVLHLIICTDNTAYFRSINDPWPTLG